MSLRLRVVATDGRRFEHDLEGDAVVIGRSSRAGLALVDRAMSREHARIYREDDHWKVEDLGSHNGTRLNEIQISVPQTLRDGDTVSLGGSVLVVEIHGEGGPPSGDSVFYRSAKELLQATSGITDVSGSGAGPQKAAARLHMIIQWGSNETVAAPGELTKPGSGPEGSGCWAEHFPAERVVELQCSVPGVIRFRFSQDGREVPPRDVPALFLVYPAGSAPRHPFLTAPVESADGGDSILFEGSYTAATKGSWHVVAALSIANSSPYASLMGAGVDEKPRGVFQGVWPGEVTVKWDVRSTADRGGSGHVRSRRTRLLGDARRQQVQGQEPEVRVDVRAGGRLPGGGGPCFR
jgi:hypothetical protein